MPEPSNRSKAFRSAIAVFIDERREAKLKGNEDDTEATSKYDYATWLADAARRAEHLQTVTHVLKATHPSARGSNLYTPPPQMINHREVGTHSLGDNFVEDTAVSDAKHLDVFAFLKHEFEGRRINDWIRDGDSDLHKALDPDTVIADALLSAFQGLVRTADTVSTHPLAKQIYWLIGNEAQDDTRYHLLQPMFSSSLAHVVHADIQDARFGDTNKLARTAFRSRDAFAGTYRDYRNLVVRKLGGTKPQNISQLNSERGGVNYLLASLPPTWKKVRPRQLLQMKSAMDQFAYVKSVRSLVKALADFLLGDPPANDRTRTIRRKIEQELGAQLALFAAEISASAEPGWTRNPDCVLHQSEKLWLDPERSELPIRIDPEHPELADDDRQFNAAFEFGDWPDEVAGRFANWVNQRLSDAGLTTVGDAEYRHWAEQAIVDAAWPIPMQRRASMGGGA